MSLVATSRRARLRTATHASHERLEKISGRLTSPGIYSAYLRAQYRFRAPLEADVARLWPNEWSTFKNTIIAQALLQDVCDVDGAAAAARLERDVIDTACPRAAQASRVASVLGCLYVLEGASLGARLLLIDAKQLGHTSEKGARHLAQQCESGAVWRAFQILLEDAGHVEMNDVEDAAVKAFDLACEAYQLEFS